MEVSSDRVLPGVCVRAFPAPSSDDDPAGGLRHLAGRLDGVVQRVAQEGIQILRFHKRQLAAVRNAINNTGKVIMKNHISHCIVDAIEANDMEPVDALNEAIDYFIK